MHSRIQFMQHLYSHQTHAPYRAESFASCFGWSNQNDAQTSQNMQLNACIPTINRQHTEASVFYFSEII